MGTLRAFGRVAPPVQPEKDTPLRSVLSLDRPDQRTSSGPPRLCPLVGALKRSLDNPATSAGGARRQRPVGIRASPH
jgi:hypothetical protein